MNLCPYDALINSTAFRQLVQNTFVFILTIFYPFDRFRTFSTLRQYVIVIA